MDTMLWGGSLVSQNQETDLVQMDESTVLGQQSLVEVTSICR